MNTHLLATIAIMALTSTLVCASDPSPLQDFCVAINDTKTGVFVNGKFCKDPKLVSADDFFLSGLLTARNILNPLGSRVTLIDVTQLFGLNTLGVALGRIDYAPMGINPPHLHPRASELLLVLEGELYAGFVTSNPDNRLFTKILKPGDIFVFPEGSIHFQFNIAKTNAVSFASFGSQNPGVTTIANQIFNANPKINPIVLAKAFQLDEKVVGDLQSKFWYYTT